MSWAVIVPVALFLAGLLLSSLGWAAVEDDPRAAAIVERIVGEAASEPGGFWSKAGALARASDIGAELREVGMTRAAWMIDNGPILSIVGAVLGVVSTAAVLTVG